MILKLRQIRKSINNIIKVGYVNLSDEDYLLNQRDAMLVQKRQKTELQPLPNSNHSEDTSDRIGLIGVVQGKEERKVDKWSDEDQQLLFEYKPDLIFLELDPSRYINLQRFMSHKCARYGLEDYDIKAVEQIDLVAPETWEETVVNLAVLDMLNQNKHYDELDLTSSLATYAHKDYQGVDDSYEHQKDQQVQQDQLKKSMIENISENIIVEFSEYYSLNKLAYTCLMNKQRVMLGGMPEVLYRQILGHSLSLRELEDLFRYVLHQMDKLDLVDDNNSKKGMGIKEASLRFIPHVLQPPRDNYHTALLKEAFQCSVNMLAYVQMPSYYPIQHNWQPSPFGINFSEAVRIPDRIHPDTDQQLVQKQALLDAILQTRVYSHSYISNPFPYIHQDITQISQQSLQQLKSTFKYHYQYYNDIIQSHQKKQQLTSAHKFQIQSIKIPLLNNSSQSQSQS